MGFYSYQKGPYDDLLEILVEEDAKNIMNEELVRQEGLIPAPPRHEVARAVGHAPANAMELMAMCITGQVDIALVKEVRAMVKEEAKELAEKAFHDAMSAFQLECPVILKTTPGPAGRYDYAKLDHIDVLTKELRKKHGFSHTFDTDDKADPGFIIVIIEVAHTAGHRLQRRYKVPVSNTRTASGGSIMNETQFYSAALTTGMRRVFCNAFGILTADQDTDGHTPQIKEYEPIDGDPLAKKPDAAEQRKMADEALKHANIVVKAIDRDEAKARLWSIVKKLDPHAASWDDVRQWCANELDPNTQPIKDLDASQISALADKAAAKIK